MPDLFTINTRNMQKITAAGVIHMPNLTEFCNQVNGRAYIFEACQTGQHFRNWYLYVTGFDQWGCHLMLTLHAGDCFIDDRENASRIKEKQKTYRTKAEEVLREKEITILGGFVGNHEFKMIGDL